MIRVMSLFAGIGGFDLGFERAGGFKTVAVCEIEPFQRALLKQHWPDAVQYEDIHALGHVECDLICGGFPCQKFSTASHGRRVAADLWPEMYRVISIIKPTYVVAENVSEDAIRTAEQQLASVGYAVTVRNISGSDCGAPHVRSRWWLVAHPHKESEFQRALNAEVAKLPELCSGLWGAETYARAIRVSDGLPYRVHRVEALGNAVIPQIPQVIGQAIMSMRNPAPAPQAASTSPFLASLSPDQRTIHDALCDSSYIAGAKAAWNASCEENPVTAREKFDALVKSRDGYLKEYSAALAATEGQNDG